ncbi:MAG: alpha/beta hydrolase [bacterium]|nr:alpha/beta hydrolase [bacterium]
MKDILLLHGALGSKEQMNPIAELLKTDYNIHSFNFEGHGSFSSNGDLSMTLFANSIKKYITDNGLNKPDVFGYSMGGYAALKLASFESELLGKIVTLGTKLDWSEESLNKMMGMFNPEVIEAKVPKLAMGLAKVHGEDRWKSLVTETGEMLKSLSSTEFIKDEEFAKIENQIVLGIGDKDVTVSVSETKRVNDFLPNSKIQVLKDVPHELHKADLNVVMSLFD